MRLLATAALGLSLTLAANLFPRSQGVQAPATPFARALALAEKALAENHLERARAEIARAQERDPRSVEAWALRARWAEAAGERDELVYSRHREVQLTLAQGLKKAERAALTEALYAVDPLAREHFELCERTIAKLEPLALEYEEAVRRHSAIRVHKEILALDPERASSLAAVERLASAPDPSLAADAKPKDLLAGVDEAWIAKHDAVHSTWAERARLQRTNYTTQTNAGYEVLVRAAEAMEQMNAFYREFFQYGTEKEGSSVGRIDLLIFGTRDEYLKLGSGPPADWSGGQFTGGTVETYIGAGGFEEMTGTLFHEAAHQFVSLATSSAGWLNEGLASFFEGCRILSNGSVIMNLPANHRLFPLAERMQAGWMSSADDGIDAANPSKSNPRKAPTFRIVLENEYEWGPPWYDPTWGVVFFLYNFEDPIDGRFVYRNAFRAFIDASGGRVGEGAVANFEEVVLSQPEPPTKGVLPGLTSLPKTVSELDQVWKDWILRLQREVSGREEVKRPYLDWARYAIQREDWKDAAEHFEKGALEDPENDVLLQEFAALLAGRLEQPDRAAKLVRSALQVVEAREPVDTARVEALERELVKHDPAQKTLAKVRADLVRETESLVQRYVADGLHLQAMDLAWRMSNDFQATTLLPYFEEAARRSRKSLALWRMAYNEVDLKGWADMGNTTFEAHGELLHGAFEGEKEFDFRFLVLDEVTSGDFSMEAEISAERGQVGFTGLVFGRKTSTDFHAAILFPPGFDEAGAPVQGFVDLTTFYGDASFDIWRHSPVPETRKSGESQGETWRKLRVDVTGKVVDVWLDGEFVASQEFGGLSVLRGAFGLILGPGKARYRNVRYLARAARDPGSEVERSLRMESLAGAGGSRGNSWLGAEPPFPKVGRWTGAPRSAWQEKLGAPQLLVLWSIGQNDQIRLDQWLADLVRRHADVGLEVVAIANAWDAEKLDLYLKDHPFPGAVGVDALDVQAGQGRTFQDFFVYRLQLPRVLIVDVDGKVAWEGDPGFKIGAPWASGEESYVDAPLEELILKRKLRELNAWRKTWVGARAALARGEAERAAEVLKAAAAFDWRTHPDVLVAQSALRELQAALADPVALARELADAGREPALVPLVAWAQALGTPIDLGSRDLKPLLKGEGQRGWDRVLAMLKPVLKKLADGKDPGDVAALAARMSEIPGPFPAELSESLRAAGDPEAQRGVLLGAERFPARWLAREHFGWE